MADRVLVTGANGKTGTAICGSYFTCSQACGTAKDPLACVSTCYAALSDGAQGEYAALAQGGQNGFFSYADNIDLKYPLSDAGNRYPNWMPRIQNIPHPSATVMMFDVVFNPVTEVVNGSPQYNSVNPANRYRSIGTRHSDGTVINFCDGHAAYFKIFSVTNNPTQAPEPENPEIIWNFAKR